jgi:hypothetical protein
VYSFIPRVTERIDDVRGTQGSYFVDSNDATLEPFLEIRSVGGDTVQSGQMERSTGGLICGHSPEVSAGHDSRRAAIRSSRCFDCQ